MEQQTDFVAVLMEMRRGAVAIEYSKRFNEMMAAGIIGDDRQISSWGDSSRDLRDKANPRIEVSIEVIG